MSTSIDSGKYFSQPVRLCVDLVLVLIFITIGLMSHGQPLSGLLTTALPFLLAALIAHIGVWAVSVRRYLPLLLEGIMLWVTTLALGMALRISFGDTAATAFVIVATLSLLLFLVGWRLILLLVRK